MGRPSDYSQEIADAICERIADGESLRAICSAEEYPNKATVFRWLNKNIEFSDQYARAREAQADSLADELLDIADDGSNDWMQRHNDKGEAIGWQINGEHIQRSRVRVDTRKWVASKLKPKKYGDKVTNEHTGADGGPIKAISEIVRTIVRPKPSDSNG